MNLEYGIIGGFELREERLLCVLDEDGIFFLDNVVFLDSNLGGHLPYYIVDREIILIVMFYKLRWFRVPCQ